jgi:hypothetical protein
LDGEGGGRRKEGEEIEEGEGEEGEGERIVIRGVQGEEEKYLTCRVAGGKQLVGFFLLFQSYVQIFGEPLLAILDGPILQNDLFQK